MIENSRKHANVEMLWRIAAALDMRIECRKLTVKLRDTKPICSIDGRKEIKRYIQRAQRISKRFTMATMLHDTL